jgi:protein-tyrosine phosphatase
MKLDKIVVVCTGNICRSPMAEALLKSYIPNKEIYSAGLDVMNNDLQNQSPVEQAQLTASKYGFDISNHRATQLTTNMVNEMDLILVMTQEQIDQIAIRFPGCAQKTLLIGQWGGVGYIQDPLNQDLVTFEHCFNQLKKAVISWRDKLRAIPQ